MARSRTLIAVVVTVLLSALLAGMALATTGPTPPTPAAPPAVPHAPGPGNGYGYGYGYGYGGDGCSRVAARCGGDVRGTVYDAARYRALVAGGASTEDATRDASIAGALVTVQRRRGGGWIDAPEVDRYPAENPQTADALGRFVWLVRGIWGDEVRVIASAPGHTTVTSDPRDIFRSRTFMNVGLEPSEDAPPTDGGTTTTPTTPTPTPTPTTTPTTGDGARSGGGTTGGQSAPPVATPAGCASKKTATARAACQRAVKLAAALKTCRKQKGAKRTLCERRARALSACDAKTGRKRAACRTKALAIGKTTKTTKKKR